MRPRGEELEEAIKERAKEMLEAAKSRPLHRLRIEEDDPPFEPPPSTERIIYGVCPECGSINFNIIVTDTRLVQCSRCGRREKL